MIQLNLGNIEDTAVKQALESLIEQLNAQTFIKGEWAHIEFTIPNAGTTIYELNHGLKFRPIDIIETHRDPSVTLIFDKTKFTPTTVYFTATGKGVVRFYVGKHKRGV